MLLLEKYRPDSSNKQIIGLPHLFHPTIIDQLVHFGDTDEMPHMIIAGQQSAGKKTILHFLLHALFAGHASKTRKQVYKAATSSTKINVLIEQSDYHLIIEATNTNRDRHILLEVVRSYACYRSFGCLPSERSFKAIVINNAHLMTNNSQSVLRGIMEEYADVYRFILICDNLSQLMDPIRSRAAVFRVPTPGKDQIHSALRSILSQERIQLTDAQREDVMNKSDNKFGEAIWKLQAIRDGFYRGGDDDDLEMVVSAVTSWLNSRPSWTVTSTKISYREYEMTASASATGRPTALLNQIVLTMLHETRYRSIEMYYQPRANKHVFKICLPEASGTSSNCFRTSNSLDCIVTSICLSNLVPNLPQLCYLIRQQIYPISTTIADASMVIEKLMVKLTTRIQDPEIAMAISSFAEEAEHRQCSGHRQIAIHIDDFVISVIRLVVRSGKCY